MCWIADAFRSLPRALSALRGERRTDWVATSIALFTASTVLASVTIAGYVAFGIAILDGKGVKPDIWLVRLGSFTVVLILLAYFAVVVSSLSIIFHTVDALRAMALRNAATALYLQAAFTIIFTLVAVLGSVFLYEHGDSSSKPLITSANYDPIYDQVVLAWEMGDTNNLLAFRIERRVAQAAARGTHEELIGPQPNKGRFTDNRPIVGKVARTYFDSRPPAARLISYTVWAVYPDGSELASEPVMPQMDGPIVRVRIHGSGNREKYFVSWVDDSRTVDASGCDMGKDEYKVYLETKGDGLARWIQLTTNVELTRNSHEFTLDYRLYQGSHITVRVMCGGSSPDTGVLIGEDTSRSR